MYEPKFRDSLQFRWEF